MNLSTDREILHLEPDPHWAWPRYFWRSVLLLLLMVLVGVTVYVRESNKPAAEVNERAAVVSDFLATNYAGEPWYDSILDVIIKDHKLYVKTDQEALNLPSNMDNETKMQLLTESYARQIYEVLWDWHWDVPELEFYYVIIQNRDGDYIDGGQA